MSSEAENKAEAVQASEPKAGSVAPDAERLATLERENADLKDRLLRALAEMEN
ncbi:MAG TPA: nucleotide exchange factor GrpE, partial [Rhabdaerophilum sp.]|nr:nucleotide exchange factor GrpE [Rhabdaerophilum sp.]